MTWTGFDGRAYTRVQFAAHVASLRWTDWKPAGITLHNTAAPRLDQWAESGPKHDARIANLKHYYETQLGWHAGPHLFISRNFINGFSDLTKPGVHSRCYNATHIGIEMVGDYSVEEFDSGDGAMVRDNAVFALATLFTVLNLDPVFLAFHKDCKRDNHDCPGRKVNKADVIQRVKLAMGQRAPETVVTGLPWLADYWQEFPSPRLAWAQDSLNRLTVGAFPIPVDGIDGPKTRNSVRAFQRGRNIAATGLADDGTVAAIIAALAAL